ncbi:DUF1467 family protein [Donghicola sp. C2-DW-16]|uniref:DUF1467 family protein n=1 Tax=Donghicola mangrovi TaxID=2729614 RepID=A0A850Q7I5_9RHOB|nr:DUF1467 family protein [Donghicola mangrovi]NVO24152.1 DUF1467 family protein [Donghicola mangrovi]NVO28280.1 DUF1467 family protein [Donghicola mangrovi]
MTITAAIVLYAICWFMTLFITLPLKLRTQGDEGEVVPGTPAGAPADFKPKRVALIVTIWGTLIWAAIASVIVFGGLSIRDMDPWKSIRPQPIEVGK